MPTMDSLRYHVKRRGPVRRRRPPPILFPRRLLTEYEMQDEILAAYHHHVAFGHPPPPPPPPHFFGPGHAPYRSLPLPPFNHRYRHHHNLSRRRKNPPVQADPQEEVAASESQPTEDTPRHGGSDGTGADVQDTLSDQSQPEPTSATPDTSRTPSPIDDAQVSEENQFKDSQLNVHAEEWWPAEYTHWQGGYSEIGRSCTPLQTTPTPMNNAEASEEDHMDIEGLIERYEAGLVTPVSSCPLARESAEEIRMNSFGGDFLSQDWETQRENLGQYTLSSDQAIIERPLCHVFNQETMFNRVHLIESPCSQEAEMQFPVQVPWTNESGEVNMSQQQEVDALMIDSPNDNTESGMDSSMSSCAPSSPTTEFPYLIVNPLISPSTQILENDERNIPGDDACNLRWLKQKTPDDHATQVVRDVVNFVLDECREEIAFTMHDKYDEVTRLMGKLSVKEKDFGSNPLETAV